MGPLMCEVHAHTSKVWLVAFAWNPKLPTKLLHFWKFPCALWVVCNITPIICRFFPFQMLLIEYQLLN